MSKLTVTVGLLALLATPIVALYTSAHRPNAKTYSTCSLAVPSNPLGSAWTDGVLPPPPPPPPEV
ncbi:MAG: hypothetical protein PHX83_03500 [Acidobacteriia bacterium]|nr:hypothetical protein [Terriglobia bacterium]